MIEQNLMNLGILFLGAIIGGILAVRFRQPAVIGLLLIGAIIGPNMLNLVNDPEIIEMMAEFGSILLMFVIGLEFVIPKLIKIGFKAIMIGVLKIGILFFITYEVSSIFLGLSQKASLILGVMLSISSTVVIVKILESKGLYEREEMPLLIGVLIIEDIFAVIVITFLSGAKTNTGIIPLLEHLIISMSLIILAYTIMLKLSKYIIPFLIKNSSEETTTFLALGICAGFSYFTYYLGLAPATGAFLAGSIVASLSQAKLFEHAIKPYTLTFSSLFFISVGTMVNFSVLQDNIKLLVVIIILICATRFIAVGLVSFLFANFKKQQMIFSSIAMISVGEFSLLIAKSSAKLNLGLDFVSIAAFIIFITAIIMSISITYFSAVTEMISYNTPKGFNDQPKSFSTFIRAITEQIDLENSHSINFKNYMVECLLILIYTLAIQITGRRTIVWAISAFNLVHWQYYLLYSLLVIVILLFIYRLAVKLKQMYDILATIITNLDSSANYNKSDYILNRLLLALGLLLITIYSPIILVVFKMPWWINIVSLVLLAYTTLKFRNLFSAVHYSFTGASKNHKKVF